MTTEEKLSAVIQAQMKGGFPLFDLLHDEMTELSGSVILARDGDGEEWDVNILEVLFHPKGLKAIWGDRAKVIGEAIFRAWFDGGTEHAIETYYNLIGDAQVDKDTKKE